MKTRPEIHELQEQLSHVVVSFIRAREEADRCEREYLRVKQLPGCETEAAAHWRKARALSKKAAELLERYERLKQVH